VVAVAQVSALCCGIRRTEPMTAIDGQSAAIEITVVDGIENSTYAIRLPGAIWTSKPMFVFSIKGGFSISIGAPRGGVIAGAGALRKGRPVWRRRRRRAGWRRRHGPHGFY